MPDRNRQDVRVLVLTGSLRRKGLNYQLAELAAVAARASGAIVETACLADYAVPLYDQDLEQEVGIAEGAKRFGDALKACDALFLASPEYNASLPGVVKNLLDWTSRLRPQPFNGKQALLLSASPSMAGGNRGLWALRVPLEHLGMRVYPDMFSLARAHEAYGEHGRLANPVLQQRLEETVDCFLDLVEAACHYPTLRKHWVEFLGEHPDAATDRVETSPAEAA